MGGSLQKRETQSPTPNLSHPILCGEVNVLAQANWIVSAGLFGESRVAGTPNGFREASNPA
jgi:hypothetical protein